MNNQPLQFSVRDNVRESLAGKLKTARSLAELSTRAVAQKLSKRFPISHASLANYESGRSTPSLDLLAALADLYERPINWFLEGGKSLSDVQYRNLKSRVLMSDLHRFEAEVQRWLDGYVSIERRLDCPLKPSIDFHQVTDEVTPIELSLRVRRYLNIGSEVDPIQSVVEILEKFGIRVLENQTNLCLDGMAAKFGSELVVVLNPDMPHDRMRLMAAQELAHFLYQDSKLKNTVTKGIEARASEFASYLLLTNGQLKRAFEGRSMVRLVQFKEKYGISLAAMIYRAEKLEFISTQMAKSLWSAFAERGWKTNEPGVVRQDRARRFESLIEEAIYSSKLSMKEVADLCGVKADAIRFRLDYAMGIRREHAPGDEGADTVKLPDR